jgi:RNA 2',3'-cyclic 3'-phosphodiesterase
VELPDKVKRAIAERIDALKRSGAEVKWVSIENIHITMQFLGETEETLIPMIKESLKKILSPYTPFYIKIAKVGCFPEGKRPRIIWIGVEDAQPLKNIHAEITNEMMKYGFRKEERDFTPHITIGRVKSQRNLGEMHRRLTEMKDTCFSDFEVFSLTLMKSTLKPSGAVYNSLAEIPFGRRSNNVDEGQG